MQFTKVFNTKNAMKSLEMFWEGYNALNYYCLNYLKMCKKSSAQYSFYLDDLGVSLSLNEPWKKSFLCQYSGNYCALKKNRSELIELKHLLMKADDFLAITNINNVQVADIQSEIVTTRKSNRYLAATEMSNLRPTTRCCTITVKPIDNSS